MSHGRCLLQLNSLSVTTVKSSETILESANAILTDGSRVGLVGPNGCGKSTLLKILSQGEIKSDSGEDETKEISYWCIKSGSIEGILSPDFRDDDSVLLVDQDILCWSRLFPGVGSEKELLELPLPEAFDLAVALGVQSAYDDAELWRSLCVTADNLLGWNLANYTQTPIKKLSPGAAFRAYIAVALRRPGVRLLLLDEPTNHLDLPSILWLKAEIIASRKAFVVVSHDEAFLNEVANYIWEIDTVHHNLTVSTMQYSVYKQSKLKAIEAQRRAYEGQQRRHKKLSTAAEKLRTASKKGEFSKAKDHDLMQRDFRRNRAGRSGKKAATLERLRDSEKKIERVVDKEPLKIRLEPISVNNDSSIMLNEVRLGHTKQVADDSSKADEKSGNDDNKNDTEAQEMKPLPLPPLSFRLDYGERVALIGYNSIGKSTLLHTLTGMIQPMSGSVYIGKDLIIGNLMQEHQSLPRKITPRAYLATLTGEDMFVAGSRVIGFGLTYHQVDMPIEDLNPGARARLLLASFSMRRVNMLVLDEPTNHLDEEAVSELTATLNEYEGIVLVVSHDRCFLESLRLSYTLVLSPQGLSRIDSIDLFVNEIEEAVEIVVAKAAMF